MPYLIELFEALFRQLNGARIEIKALFSDNKCFIHRVLSCFYRRPPIETKHVNIWNILAACATLATHDSIELSSAVAVIMTTSCVCGLCALAVFSLPPFAHLKNAVNVFVVRIDRRAWSSHTVQSKYAPNKTSFILSVRDCGCVSCECASTTTVNLYLPKNYQRTNIVPWIFDGKIRKRKKNSSGIGISM